MNRQARSGTRKALITTTALLCAGLSTAATAQAAPAQTTPAASGPEQTGPAASGPANLPANSNSDIVVTARQRNETLISVPVSVTAVNGQTLRNYGITDAVDIAKFTPSLLLDRGGSGGGGNLSLRGVGSQGIQAGFEQAVSIYVDGIPTGRPRILTQGLFDVDQVEVLKGPQALFFGKNSPAGVVSIKTAGPTSELAGYVRAAYEFVGDEPTVEGALSGPLGKGFGARIAVRYRNLNGYLRNVAPSPIQPLGFTAPLSAGVRRPGQEEFVGRLTLAYKPQGSDFDATLKLSASDYKDDGPAAGNQLFNCGRTAAGVPLTAGYSSYFGIPVVFADSDGCKFDNRYAASGLPAGYADNWPFARQQPYQKTRQYLGALTLNYTLSNFALTSITGYYDLRNKAFDNYDATAAFFYAAAEGERYNAISQELRLRSQFSGVFNFMVGGFYQNTNLSFDNSSRIAPVPADPATGKFQSWDRLGRTDGTTLSVFGQAIFNLTQQVELSGGVRYTDESKDSSLVHTYRHPLLAGFILAPGIALTDRYRDDNFSPEATLTWRPTSDLTAYVGYKTGYKSGGFGLSTVLTAGLTAPQLAFGAERVKGYEAGVKARLFDRRLTLTSTAYSYKYSDLQVSTFDSATTSFVISNAAAARVKGVEVEANLRATSWFSLQGAIAYNDAKYLNYRAACYPGQTAVQGCNPNLFSPGIAGYNESGIRLPRAPKLSASAGFNADVPVSDGLKAGLSGNTRYSSSYFIVDGVPDSTQRAYWLLDAGVRLTSTDDRYQIGLTGRNLTNRYYATIGNNKPGTATGPGIASVNQIAAIPNRGRQISLELTLRY